MLVLVFAVMALCAGDLVGAQCDGKGHRYNAVDHGTSLDKAKKKALDRLMRFPAPTPTLTG